MKLNLIATGILSFSLAGAGSAQGTTSSAENDTHYAQAQLKQLMREAHTPEQYQVLAGYYAEQQKHYLQQAAEEKQEWVRRSQNVASVAAKYPRPVDSARYLYEYYTLKASESGDLAAKYAQLAPPALPSQAK
jgi:imidazolonepropionase-like amidohydrolase